MPARSTRMASPQQRLTLAKGATASSSAPRNRSSTSTTCSLATFGARYAANTPSPPPISSTTSSGLSSASRPITPRMLRSRRKFCPSSRLGRTPTMLSAAGLHADGALDLGPLGGERPRVRRPPGLPFALVVDQAQVLQAREQLRDLPLVRDPRRRGHPAVARPRVLRDRDQHPHRAVGQAHIQTIERVAARARFCFELGGRSL